ncbi:MAG: hypothetical protein JW741_12785 [Sedimentisphaerales bacterium]|nr:hypothetical protein [Sedimentisphaerales bacterium]
MIRTEEPYNNPAFLSGAKEAAERSFANLVEAHANGGYFDLNGVWRSVSRQTLVETDEADPEGHAWHYLAQKSFPGGGQDEARFTRYFKAAA